VYCIHVSHYICQNLNSVRVEVTAVTRRAAVQAQVQWAGTSGPLCRAADSGHRLNSVSGNICCQPLLNRRGHAVIIDQQQKTEILQRMQNVGD
jgi:hypothetical protein